MEALLQIGDFFKTEFSIHGYIYSMILPTFSGARYPKLPQPPQRKKFLHKLLVKGPGYLPGVGYVGEILDSFTVPRFSFRR